MQTRSYDSIPEPIVVLTPQLNIDAINLAAQQFWGRSGGALIGRALDEILGPNRALTTLCERAAASGGDVRAFDVEVDRLHLGSVICDISASVMDQKGRVLVLIMQRTTSSQSQGIHAGGRASESLYHMVSMLAHEIKNPLAGIKGAAQLLDISSNSSGVELTQLIIEETDRLAALVDQFDFFSNSIETKKGGVNVHEVLARAEHIAQNSFGKHVRFEKSYDPSLPEVWGDRDRLVQVFLNLVKNACEALADEGNACIRLATRFDHGHVILAEGGIAVDAPLTVTISDNGPGIPAEWQTQIFEPFRTAKEQGTGLGLSIVTKILADHQAAIEFTSQPGDTRFTINFPMQSSGHSTERG